MKKYAINGASNLLDLFVRYKSYKKIVTTLKNVSRYSVNMRCDDIEIEHLDLWRQVAGRVSSKWVRAYSASSGIWDSRYVPEYVYYSIVEPRLNSPALSKAYSDKNMYELIYRDDVFVPAVARSMKGGICDHFRNEVAFDHLLADAKREHDRLVVKPSIETGGGKGVRIFSRNADGYSDKEGNRLSREFLDGTYGLNYVVQPFVAQHAYFAQLNESSLNTVRIYTYRSVESESIVADKAVLRMGRKNMHVDNQSSGGITVPIGECGRVGDFAIDMYGSRFYESPARVRFSIMGPVPHIDEMRQIACKLAQRSPYHRVLGFDFCVTEGGEVRVVEINNRMIEVNFMQLLSGPLFGQYTHEIIRYCADKQREPWLSW